MFYFVLMFKYASKWHIDCFSRDVGYDKNSERDRLWFIEASKFAVERLNLREENCRSIEEAILYELVLKKDNNGESAKIELVIPPVDAISNVMLSKDEH